MISNAKSDFGNNQTKSKTQEDARADEAVKNLANSQSSLPSVRIREDASAAKNHTANASSSGNQSEKGVKTPMDILLNKFGATKGGEPKVVINGKEVKGKDKGRVINIIPDAGAYKKENPIVTTLKTLEKQRQKSATVAADKDLVAKRIALKTRQGERKT
jgi:hypothetical protein